NRRLSAHVRVHSRRRPQLPQDVVRVALRLGEVEAREDRAVDDGAGLVPQAGGLPAGNCGRAALNRALERKPDARRAGPALVDDDELAVRTIPEVLLQDRASTLGVGSRDGERVREQWRQLRRRVDAGEQNAQPEAEDRPAETQDETGPAGHESRLDSPGTVRPW